MAQRVQQVKPKGKVLEAAQNMAGLAAHPKTRVKEFKELRRIERKTEEYWRQRDAAKQMADEGMAKLNQLVRLINPYNPQVVIDPFTSSAGYFKVTRPGHIAISPRIVDHDGTMRVLDLNNEGDRKDLRDTVYHELTHYSRAQISEIKNPRIRVHSRIRTATEMHLLRSVEEGVAAFVGSYLNYGNTGDAIMLLARGGAVRGIDQTYDALRAGANSHSLMEYMSGFRHRQYGKASSGRLLRSYIKVEAHEVGNRLAILLLAKNGFDMHETAVEMMTRSNKQLIEGLFAAVESDDGRIKRAAVEINRMADRIIHDYNERQKKNVDEIRNEYGGHFGELVESMRE